jgi:RHS repeat-associated protein
MRRVVCFGFFALVFAAAPLANAFDYAGFGSSSAGTASLAGRPTLGGSLTLTLGQLSINGGSFTSGTIVISPTLGALCGTGCFIITGGTVDVRDASNTSLLQDTFSGGTVIVSGAVISISGTSATGSTAASILLSLGGAVTASSDTIVTTASAPVIAGPIPPPLANGSPQANSTVAFASEPVNTGNGSYYYQHLDLTIPSRGLPLVFQRSYNSLDSYSGPLGANWTHSFNVILTQTSAGVANVRWGDGHGETFTLTGTTYVPQPGVFSSFAANTDGSYTLTQNNQVKYNFSSTGQLTGVRDRNGNTVLLGYDGSGNLIQVTDAVGRNLTLSYDGSNRITQIVDPIGRTTSYAYDGSNNLSSVTDAAGGVTQYAYDGNHRVISIAQPNSSALLQNSYDSSGRVVSQMNGRGFPWQFAYGTPSAGSTTITDARGNQTVHTYDPLLRVIQITDPLGGATSYAYDSNNNRTSVTNPTGGITTFAYDSQGNVTGVADPLSGVSIFAYDATNNLRTAANPKGRSTSFTYDPNGNLVTIVDAAGKTTTLGYDGFGELISRQDARGNTVNYGYDASGNLTSIKDPLGEVSSLSYDGIGRLLSVTDPNGHVSQAIYDPLSRLVKASDPLGGATQFAYDAVGNLLKLTDANGHSTSYSYDPVNNLISVTDAAGHVTTYGYDQNNNRTSFTNAKGAITAYTFDPLNRLVAITDPLSFLTAYSYDAAGNVVSKRDAIGNLNRFTYDALNHLIAISYADGKSVAYAYDSDGKRTSMTDSHGATAYAYDLLDRLTSVTDPIGRVVQYGYDGVGNRVSLVYPDSKTVSYSYDPANRLSQVQDWLGRFTKYSYDLSSNLTGITYPNQASLSLTYDAANRLTRVNNSYRSSAGNPIATFAYVLDPAGNRLQVTDGSNKVTSYSYDVLNELTKVTSEGKPTSFSYDTAGNRVKLTAPGVSIAYTYDADDRLLNAGVATFTYDANGNEASVARTAGGSPVIYGYDAANRLTTAAGGLVNNAFVYDGDGNRVGQSNTIGTYSYVNDVATAFPVVLQESGPDKLVTYGRGLALINASSPAFEFFYQYDGLGSVAGLTRPNGELLGRYVYDAWGQPTLVSPDPKTAMRNKFAFTAEAIDPGTGLYFLRARYYDPNVGRFTSSDSFSASVASPIDQNRYVYVRSNPIRYTDPSGFSTMDQSAAGTNSPAQLAATSVNAPTASASTAGLTTSIIAGGCRVIGVFQTIFVKTSAFLASGALYYIASNGGSQPVSNVPCYSNLPGVGLFFSSVPTAR